MNECIYCAVNSAGEIQWVVGSSRKTRYFRTNTYLRTAVEYHNKYHPEDVWHIAQFRLVCIAEEAADGSK